jgi:hypothetical protein
MQAYFVLDILESAPGKDLKAHATLTRQNQPEFHADAPWRLEPDQDHIPQLFIIREANLRDGGCGPWHLAELRVEQQVGGALQPWRSHRPGTLPGVDADGFFEGGRWSYNTRIDLKALHGVDLQGRGRRRGTHRAQGSGTHWGFPYRPGSASRTIAGRKTS